MSSDPESRRPGSSGAPPIEPVASRQRNAPLPEPGYDAAAPPRDLVAEIDVSAAHRLEPRGVIGSGGMGDVLRVHDRALRRQVAKKVIHDELHADPRTQRSFVREARITAQLDHPHIVPVHDMGVDADGRMFFTMKLVEGHTLSALIDALPDGPIPHETLLNLLDVVVKICDALALAHSRGVLHCDLKPGNVMVGEFGQVYLMDWGVARILPAPADADAVDGRRVSDSLPPSGAELAGAICGTPSHMSPEQALGAIDQLTERSDVFLVGALLYHVVTRRPPYTGETVMAALVMAATGKRPSIEALPGGELVPRELRRIIDRAMATDPADRFPSVETLKDALVRFTRGVVDFPRAHVAAGEVIIRQGDVGDAAYRIASGTCRVSIAHGDEVEHLREMGPGECFGETAILSPGPRTATVTAITDMVLEVITREELERELSGMRPWMAAFIRTLADRFREREERDR